MLSGATVGESERYPVQKMDIFASNKNDNIILHNI